MRQMIKAALLQEIVNRKTGGGGGTGMNIRYIRDWCGHSQIDGYSNWREIMALDSEGFNVAAFKTIINPFSGAISYIIDNNFDTLVLGNGLQNVLIDLGALYNIMEIKVWHYYDGGEIHQQTKTEVSVDGISWTTIFDSAISGTYTETEEGKTYIL